MAFGKQHTLIALVGIAAFSGAAWWYQKAPAAGTGAQAPVGGSGLAATGGGAGGAAGGATPRAASVEIAQVETMSLQDDAQAIGTLKSRQSVMLRPEVAGRIAGLGFSDGARVRAGQVLVQLDDTLQRAEVKQSLAQLAIAQSNLKRNQELVAQNFVAQRVLDENATSLQVAQAQLALSCARLGRMAVLAPFDAVAGLRSVNPGDYVKDGADLVNLEDIGSMVVDFRLPERFAGKVKTGQTVSLALDAFPNRQFKASIQAVDPLLDANGRSVGLRAVLPNTAGEPLAVPGKSGAPGQAVPSKAGFETPKLPQAPASKPAVAAVQKSKPAAPASFASALPSFSESMAQAGCPMADRGGAGNSPVGKKVTGAMQAGGAKPAATAKPTAGGPAPLRPGMFARVTTIFAVRDNALVIPEEAVVPQGGKQFVVRVVRASELPPAPPPINPVSGTAGAAPVSPPAAPAAPLAPETLVSLRQEVKLGLRKQGKVEVSEGLQLGQTIVVAGHQRLQKDGTPVKVIELGKPPAPTGNAPAGAGAPLAPASK